MNIPADRLFLSHPDPMWIYELATLRFLAVNDAAILKYGYSRDEFLAMTIADIRPAEDRAALERSVAAVSGGRDEAGVWRHCLKSGDFIHVDITGQTLEYGGRAAELISARDISRLVIAEQTAQRVLVREQAARRASDALSHEFQRMFDSVPGMFLVFSPDSFNVIAVSDAYLALVDAKRSDLVGQNVFKALPWQPDDETHSALRASFDRVLDVGITDFPEVQKFLLDQTTSRQGDRLLRHWAVTSALLTGRDGKPLHLVLTIQDVTDGIGSLDGPLQNRGKINILARANELKFENQRLAELAVRLRTTQRLLATGSWEYTLTEDRMQWSDGVYDIYGVTPEAFDHSFEAYVALVHPDDRAAMRSNFEAFMASGGAVFEFAHRIVHADGRIVHVLGVAEKVDTANGSLLRGVVQNVTDRVEADRNLAQARRMLEIAGTSAHFGGWRYDAQAEKLHWSPETARIHEEPEDISPSLAQAIGYYVPEHRERITALFRACLDRGEPFDAVLEIIRAKGQRRWVRVTGEADRGQTGEIRAIQGSFQDVTELITARQQIEKYEKLVAFAGSILRSGGWEVSLSDQKVSWTPGIATLHELPTDTAPTYDGGIHYFAPEEQADARKVFDACATEGIPFDDVRDLITAKGNRIRVRSVGQAVRDPSGMIIAVQGAMQDISELTYARQKVDELSARLAETLENIGDAFYMLDRDWRFTYLNHRAEILLQRPRQELIGRRKFDEFAEAFDTRIQAEYTRAMDTGETVRFEHFYQPLQTMFRIHAHPTRRGLAVYFTDITESHRRDEQLRLLDAAVAEVNEIVLITQADSIDAPDGLKIVYVNAAFERLTGYTRDEAIGQTPRILQGPKTDRTELDKIRKALEARAPVQVELVNYSKSGEEYWLEINILPILNGSGVLTHFVSIQRDITERRRATEALRLSERRFSLIARSTGTAVWEWDAVAQRQWWSDGMTEIFGHEIDVTGARPTVWRQNVHPDDIRQVDFGMARLLAGQVDTIQQAYRFRRADGSFATVEDRAFALRNDAGKIIRVLGSLTDISDRVQIEERLRQSQKLEAVGQLIGGVAHDFNNLLTIIMGNTELLQDNLDDGRPLRRYADMTAIAAERAADLTSRLLAFSRKQALQPQVLDVNVVIAGMEEMLRRTLGEAVSIEIFRGENLWLTEVDLGQVEAALLNLAINSRDAMPNGGALTIETANSTLDSVYLNPEPGVIAGQYILIAVSDTGLGIAREAIDHVFEPFFTTKAAGKGSGLGLSMVYGFVKQSGGLIRIYSEVGEGTTVRMYFPRFVGKEQTLDAGTEDSQVVHGQETVLVVEDDALILQQVTAQLVSLGYRVLAVSEGGPALEILRERADIDLLFTDVILPGGMNGRQIAAAAQEMRPRLRVLYTSGYSENAIVHQGRLDEGVELLCKPYRRSELAMKIRKVLDGSVRATGPETEQGAG